MTESLYGVMAEFDKPQDIVHATELAFAEGYRHMDAYSPYPIEELSEAVGFHRNDIAWVVLVGGILGGLGGYFMQYYALAVDYPINIGGRPLHSWPTFIPITFELTILCAALAAVIGMFALNGLPKPYHPVFNVPEFSEVTRHRFFLCIQAADPLFERERTRAFLTRFHPRQVYDVEP